MNTMCPPGYHHNGFVTTHALGHMMYDSYSSYNYTLYVMGKEGDRYQQLSRTELKLVKFPTSKTLVVTDAYRDMG